jgi:chromosome segregation ATPase
VRDLSDRNEEMVRQLTLERQRASDLGHSVDRMTKELDAERVERKKFERESSHKGRELAWAHSLIQELRSQINEIEGRDESQQRVQAELLTLLEQQVHDGDKVVKELQEALVRSEIQIDTLKRDLAAERERRMSLDETNQTLRAQAGEDQRKTKILIKYKENASRQMAQQHEAVLKKLFESSEVLEREYADELEPGGVLGTSWPSGTSPLRRTVEAAASSGGRVSRASTRDLSEERIVTDRRGGTTQVKKEAGGMKSYTELRMEKEAAERKLRLAQRQLKLVVYEHSKLLEKHRLMSSTKDTLLEELKTVRSAANIMERDLKEQADKMRTRSSHMEREAIFEREARARAVSECSWLREKLRSLHERVSQGRMILLFVRCTHKKILAD